MSGHEEESSIPVEKTEYGFKVDLHKDGLRAYFASRHLDDPAGVVRLNHIMGFRMLHEGSSKYSKDGVLWKTDSESADNIVEPIIEPGTLEARAFEALLEAERTDNPQS